MGLTPLKECLIAVTVIWLLIKLEIATKAIKMEQVSLILKLHSSGLEASPVKNLLELPRHCMFQWHKKKLSFDGLRNLEFSYISSTELGRYRE